MRSCGLAYITNKPIADLQFDFRDCNRNYVDLPNDFNCYEVRLNEDILFMYSRELDRETSSSVGLMSAKLSFLQAEFVYKDEFSSQTTLMSHTFDCVQRVRIESKGGIIEQAADGRKFFRLDFWINDNSFSATICCRQVVFEAFEAGT